MLEEQSLKFLLETAYLGRLGTVGDEFPGSTTNVAQEHNAVVPWGCQLAKDLPQLSYESQGITNFLTCPVGNRFPKTVKVGRKSATEN